MTDASLLKLASLRREVHEAYRNRTDPTLGELDALSVNIMDLIDILMEAL